MWPKRGLNTDILNPAVKHRFRANLHDLTPSVHGDPLRGPRNKFHHPQTCG